MTAGLRRDLLGAVFFSLIIVLLLTGSVAWLYGRSAQILRENLRIQLQTYATLAAGDFSPEELARVRSVADERTPLFVSLVHRAQTLREAMPQVRYLYVMRRTDDPQTATFIVDNDMLKTDAERDENHNGIIEPREQASRPGQSFDMSAMPAMREAFAHPTVDSDFTRDQWGTWMSAYAPIRDASGGTVAIVGLDMHAENFIADTRRIFSPMAFVTILLELLVIGATIALTLWRRRLQALSELDAQRRALVTIASHKLGGPIATLRWWLEILKGKETLRTEDCVEGKRELTGAVRRLSDVVAHLDESVKAIPQDGTLRKNLARETEGEVRGKARKKRG